MTIVTQQIQVGEMTDGNCVVITVQGKLDRKDYEAFVPEIESVIEEHGDIRILFQMIDFHGWSIGAAWEDVKFGLHHFNDVDRIAFVGDKQWEHGLALFCKPFTLAKIRYFDEADLEQARQWLGE